MKCPMDDTLLVVTERSGVEIDYCPQCRGVWLDRGELDKIIDRATDTRAPEHPAPGYPATQSRDSHHGRGTTNNRGDSRHDRGENRRREGFLGGLFDF